MKKFILILLILTCFQSGFGQILSDMLEEILPSVVTVGMFKTQALKQILGARGDASVSELAYRKALKTRAFSLDFIKKTRYITENFMELT